MTTVEFQLSPGVHVDGLCDIVEIIVLSLVWQRSDRVCQTVNSTVPEVSNI